MIIKRISQLTGVEHEMDLPINQNQLDRWVGGEKVQDVFPFLSPDQREFLMTGSTQEEWDALFGSEEDDSIDEV